MSGLEDEEIAPRLGDQRPRAKSQGLRSSQHASLTQENTRERATRMKDVQPAPTPTPQQLLTRQTRDLDAPLGTDIPRPTARPTFLQSQTQS